MKLPGPWFTKAHTIHRVVQVNVRQIVQLTLLLGLVSCALLAVPFLAYFKAESDNNLSLLQADQERVINLAVNVIHQEMDAVLSDLRYLSQHNAIRNYLASPNLATRIDLATEYQGLAGQKRIYDQVRFIGLDGMEEVRVEVNGGTPKIIGQQGLQDKHDRPYFEETLWLAPGQIYVSPFDLNIEHGSIENPFKPTIRFSVPVADSQGLIRGMVVLNYRGQRLREKLRMLEGQAGKIWLFNSQGHWIMGPTPQDEWGFMLPERAQHNLSTQFPQLWQQVQAEQSGVYHGTPAWIRFERVYPLLGEKLPLGSALISPPVDADRYYWTVAVELSQSALQAANVALLKKLWTMYGALASFAFLVAAALSFAISRNRALAQVMEKVVDHLPVMVAYVDAEQRYRFNNMAYELFFGMKPREIYGKSMKELLGDSAYHALQPNIEQALAGKAVEFEGQIAYRGAGTRDVVVAYLPDISPQGGVRGFYVMVTDISRTKDSERRERRHMLELAHVSRLSSMGEMATEIAHEINQPLAAISMYCAAGQRVLKDGSDHGQIKTWLDAIDTQTNRASEIVRRVRRFVQKQDHQFAPVDLGQTATDVAALLEHEAQSQQVSIVLDLAENLPPVHGEHILLEQVVFNLARNALDEVSSQSGERRITIRTSFDAEKVHVAVSDNGRGVDPALAAHIFDSFVTGKEGGLGMGLSISRSIVEAHDGVLRYAANPEGGSTFMFSLERADRR